MTQSRFLTLLVGLLACAPLLADSIDVSGQVVGEGATELVDLLVTIDGQAVATAADGGFTLLLDGDSAEPLTLSVSAKDYYPVVQTLHRSDFVGRGEAKLAPFSLVQKKAGRRLLLFAGDAMLARRYYEPRASEPTLVRESSIDQDARELLKYVKPYVEVADFASVNLESVLSQKPLRDALPKSVTFYSPPALADALEWAGFDYVALGNNHIFDFKDAGLKSTFAALDKTGLKYSGGGYDEQQARAPAFATINGSEHAFLSYVGWPGTFRPTQSATATKGGAALGGQTEIQEDLGQITADTTAIVQLHAGLEYAARPPISEQTLLRQSISDGADIALGHHAHVLQGFEVYNDRLIAYSLGNFLFDQYHYSTQMAMLLYVWMDGDELHRAEAVPIHMNGYVPTPAVGAFRYSILHRLAKLSDPGSVCMSANGLHAVVQRCVAQASTAAQVLNLRSVTKGGLLLPLQKFRVSPLAPVVVQDASIPYRLGVDILRRGDFEYAGLFGTHDRTWIENSQATVATYGDDKRLRVEIDAGGKVASTGQKVFERVFTVSNPATFAGRIDASGNVRMKVFLQRRRTTGDFTEELKSGPKTLIGSITIDAKGTEGFAINYNQPRIATRSVRLLIEIEDLSGDGAAVELDDLSWIEWSTPWIAGTDKEEPVYATHVQFQP